MPALLEASGSADDRIIEHSITYALIEIGDPEGTAAGLQSKNPRTTRAAMVALDQMDGGKLDPKFVAGLLASTDPALRESASWIVGRHRDWADALAGVLGDRLDRPDLPAAERAELERQLGGFAQAAPIQQLLAARLQNASAPMAPRRSSLQAMAWSNLKEKDVPPAWVAAMASVLDGKSGERPTASRPPSRPSAPCHWPGTRPRTCVPACSASPPTSRIRTDSGSTPSPLSLEDSSNRMRRSTNSRSAKLDRGQTVATRTTAADVLRGPGSRRTSSPGWPTPCGLPGRSRLTACWPPSSSRATRSSV